MKDNKSMRKTKKNCYAIHLINEKRDIVVKTWVECQNLTKGKNNLFKGFATENEAWDWLNSITEADERRHDEIVARQREIKRIKQEKKKDDEYRFRLDKKTSELFQEKLEQMHLNAEFVIKDFIKEWISMEK